MKASRKQELGAYLRAAAVAVDREDFGDLFSRLSSVMTILESEGFDTKWLLPSKRPSFSAFMESYEKQIDLSSDQVDAEAYRQLQEAASKPETVEYP